STTRPLTSRARRPLACTGITSSLRRGSRATCARTASTSNYRLARLGELVGQVRPHRRPLAGDDREHPRVAQGSVGRALMAAQDAVLLGAEPLDGAAALMVEEVGAEFDGDTA